jgi:murein L,D-transpeptidase YcbB/YkuD
MIVKVVSRVMLAAFFASIAPYAMAQQTGKPQPQGGVSLDAAPTRGTAPDPLAPPDQEGTVLIAPGAADGKPVQAEAPVPEADPIVAQILARLSSAAGRGDAREDVSGLTAFYNETKGRPIWTSKTGFTPNALKAIKEIREADDWGLNASVFQLPANPGGAASPETLAEADIKLSLAVLKYARHARGGRLDPPSLSDIIDRRPRIYDPRSVLQAIAAAENADAYLRGLHPKHEQFKRLRQALLAMNRAGGGGAAAVRIPPGPNFRPGDDHSQIALIRRRLGAAAEGPRGTLYDTALLDAVNRYQKQHGLPVTGIIDNAMRASLNEPAGGTDDEKKLRILANMERWRWMPDELGDFYVWDSIPEQLTRVFDRGRMVLMERIVVGKPNTPTPTFSANMQFIVFNPEWGVPDGIKVNEIAPKLKRAGGGGDFFFFGGGGGGGSAEVLQRLGGLRVTYNGHEIDPDTVDWSSVDIRRYQFIQAAGAKNVLGVVKFRFPNKHDVYMHDTPDRHLFNNGTRAFSHGCMRTQNPMHLAEVLLAHDKGYSPAQVHQLVETGETNEIKLSTVIPVHVAYFTAEADDKGQVHYFPDIYGLDSRVASALKGQPVHFSGDPVVSADNGDRPRTERFGPYQERVDPYQQQPRDRYRYPPPYGGRPWYPPFEDWN